MKNLLNKVVLFIIFTVITYYSTEFIPFVFVALISLCIASLMEYVNKDSIRTIIFVAFILLSIWNIDFAYYIPLILYDILLSRYQNASVLAVLPFIIYNDELGTKVIVFYIITFTVETVLKYLLCKNSERIQMYVQQRDELFEKQKSLEKKIKELADKQDIQTNIATLNERNRIAREIHDNVGHLLSSSIIQLGAIMMVTKDSDTKASLETLKETLDKGMHSIRQSVHRLHDDSVDLYNSLHEIVCNYTFCEVDFIYEVDEQPNVNCCYAIIAIIKESLTNVIKHSDATKVIIRFFEHPQFYQLVITDNGKIKGSRNMAGMGLESIKQRIDLLNGVINIDFKNGFRIFISFPKQKGCTDEDSNN